MDNAAENRLAVLETRLDTILPTLATRADVYEIKANVSEVKASLVMWLGTIVAASTAIVIAVLLFAINRVGG